MGDRGRIGGRGSAAVLSARISWWTSDSGAVQVMRQQVPRGCDALLDLVDHGTRPGSAAFLARRGRQVTLLSVMDHGTYADRRITAWRVDMHPDKKALEMLLGLVAHGTLRPVIAGILPLV